jgi:hypothetical protein
MKVALRSRRANPIADDGDEFHFCSTCAFRRVPRKRLRKSELRQLHVLVEHIGPFKEGEAALLAGNYSADERMAAFLISLSRRYAACGFSRIASD